MDVVLVHNKLMPYREPLFEVLVDEFGYDIFLFNDEVPSSFAYPESVTPVSRIELGRQLWRGGYDVVVNPDVVFLESHLDGIISMLRSMNVVQWTETWDIPGRSRRERLRTSTLLRIADLYVDQYVVPGTASEEYVISITGTSPESIHHIGGPSHIGETQSIEVTSDIVNDQTDDVPIVLFLGQVIRRKGVDVLIDAAAQIADQFDFRLVIGGCGDEKYREEMETRAVKQGLDNVTFLGWVDEGELFAEYKSADVYVLPSRADPWGISVVEAMKAGTPVILSDAVGAGRDLVDGKNTGYIFPSEDSTVLADYLADLLSDAEKRRKMGQEARTVATELMNYDRMASTIDSAVRRATSEE